MSDKPLSLGAAIQQVRRTYSPPPVRNPAWLKEVKELAQESDHLTAFVKFLFQSLHFCTLELFHCGRQLRDCILADSSPNQTIDVTLAELIYREMQNRILTDRLLKIRYLLALNEHLKERKNRLGKHRIGNILQDSEETIFKKLLERINSGDYPILTRAKELLEREYSEQDIHPVLKLSIFEALDQLHVDLTNEINMLLPSFFSAIISAKGGRRPLSTTDGFRLLAQYAHRMSKRKSSTGTLHYLQINHTGQDKPLILHEIKFYLDERYVYQIEKDSDHRITLETFRKNFLSRLNSKPR